MSNIAGGASVGQRDNQEDAYKIVFQSEQDPGGDVLMMVADGMGGHVGGEIASNLALDKFEQHFISGSNSPRPRERMKESAFVANDALRSRIEQHPELRGMGCTLLCALKLHDRVVWASIGDSHLYLYRSRQLKKINADHSIYGELMERVAAGKITKEEADAHPRKNALRSAVTGDDISLIDLNTAKLSPGDTLVLASDGLDTISQAQIAEVLDAAKRGGPEAQVQALLDAVKQAGKPTQDNTTIIVYRQGGDTALRAPTDSRWRLSNNAARGGLAGNPLALVGAGAAGAALLGVLGFLMFRAPEPPPPEPLVVEHELETDAVRPIDDGTIPEQSVIPEDGADDALPEGETPPEDEVIPEVPINRNPIEESPYPAQRPDFAEPTDEEPLEPLTPQEPEEGEPPQDAEPSAEPEAVPEQPTPSDQAEPEAPEGAPQPIGE